LIHFYCRYHDGASFPARLILGCQAASVCDFCRKITRGGSSPDRSGSRQAKSLQSLASDRVAAQRNLPSFSYWYPFGLYGDLGHLIALVGGL